ncbi:DEKNAAC101087 [Brettanomyces naardenensis]|uniref:DEKNAAC101087 n=1 Tax=Brettanomyces naardenensis TaxID=13370 RepID=A0A448YHP6_BRENA|nr:DEKNAAC101087 [Brettanomyces naardenensis]
MTDSDNDSDKIDIEKDKRELDVPNQTQPPSGKFRESDAGDGTVREDHILKGMRFYMCAISLLLCLFLVALDQMITAAVLTTISDHFNEFNKMTWIFSAFMTPLGCCAQVWARLSISFGRKWIMLSGVVLFELGSLIAGVSNSMNMFIGGRAIQGIGGSAIQSCVMIIATEITTIDKKPLLFASLSITYVVASVIGPLVGGTFGSYVTWRWCFYLNLCCGAVILPFFVFTYRPKPPVGSFMKKLKTVDWLDNFLMIAACVLILLGISFGQTEPSWKTASTICCFVLGGLLLIAFLVYNFKFSKYPTLPGDIVAKPAILMAFGTFSLNYSVLMVLAQFLSIYVQNVLGFDSFHSGLFILPCAIASGFTAIITGITMRKIRYILSVLWQESFFQYRWD